MIRLFIGYDPREPIAYHVCVDSIIKRASEPISVTPLALPNFRKFYSENHKDGSNQFIYSRFLVPYLCGWVGHALYLDGDMIVNADIAELWQMRSHWHAAQVVKHEYETKAKKKYLGAKNEDYPCKNWSSVILWNCGHYANRMLVPDYVERATGEHLHRFQWIQGERLGDLPKGWNWLATEYEDAPANLVHYTLGTPCFADYKDAPMSAYWHAAHKEMQAPL